MCANRCDISPNIAQSSSGAESSTTTFFKTARPMRPKPIEFSELATNFTLSLKITLLKFLRVLCCPFASKLGAKPPKLQLLETMHGVAISCQLEQSGAKTGHLTHFPSVRVAINRELEGGSRLLCPLALFLMTSYHRPVALEARMLLSKCSTVILRRRKRSSSASPSRTAMAGRQRILARCNSDGVRWSQRRRACRSTT